MKTIAITSMLVVAVFLVWTSPARSEIDSSGVSVSVDLGVNTISSDLDISATSISSVISASYRTSPSFSLDLDLGLAYCSSERSLDNVESSFVLGNPLLGAVIDVDLHSFLRHERIGLYAGVPLATFPGNIPENRHVEFTYNNANSMRGWSAPYTWIMNVVPVVVDLRSSLPVGEHLSADITIMPAYLLSVNRNPSQLALAGTLGVAYSVQAFTPRLSWSVFTSTWSIENNNYDQHSLCVGTDVSMGSLTGMLDLRMNLDAPNGVSVDAPKPFWGVLIGVRW